MMLRCSFVSSIGMSLVAGLLLWAGCGSNAPEMPAPSTKAMAERLDSLADHAEANPRYVLYVNNARAEQLASFGAPQDPRSWLEYSLKLAEEHLRAGNNQKAIDTYQEVLAFANERGAPPSYRLGLKDALAISYMRRGEMQNCVTDHNAERCVFPVRGEGVHTQKAAARQAMDLYLDILRADPEDSNARWLLNVAAMTVGAYPDSVPTQWRIPPEAVAPETDFPRFQDVAGRLGVDEMGLSGGAVMDDLNGDGHLDLMASSWGLRDSLRYFQNTGTGAFQERTHEAGLTGLLGGLNLIHADYNNDGHTDVLVLRGAWYPSGHPNSLLRNNGDGTFTDVTVAAGLDAAHPTQTADWADVDGDGDLDVFIGNETADDVGHNRWTPVGGDAHPCELYRNNGDGTFTNVAAEAGVDVTSYIKAAVWGDIDNDGDPDLYLSSWDSPNRLFRNDGDWTFTDITDRAGVSGPVESFPAWFFDVNNDGWQDLFVSGWRASAGDMTAEVTGDSIQAAMPRLYRNNRDGTFTDVSADANLRKVIYAMGSNFGDLDNDGWLDLYIGSGDPDFRTLIPNRAFRNRGDGTFQEVTYAGGFGHLQKGHGVAFGDLDHDGDQDVYAVMGGAFEGDVFHNLLYENPGFGHHWLTLRLEGTESNRSAIGTRIAVTVAVGDSTQTLHRTVGTGGSFGASSLQQEIGLGDAEAVESLAITWPATGRTQRFDDVPMDRILTIREDADAPVVVEQSPVRLATGPPA